MNPRELVFAARQANDLPVRQLVKDAKREGFSWADAPETSFEDARDRAVYAGLVELFAERQGKNPPAWTAAVGASPEAVILVESAKTSPAMRRKVERESPKPLKDRNVFATGQYLDVL